MGNNTQSYMSQAQINRESNLWQSEFDTPGRTRDTNRPTGEPTYSSTSATTPTTSSSTDKTSSNTTSTIKYTPPSSAGSSRRPSIASTHNETWERVHQSQAPTRSVTQSTAGTDTSTMGDIRRSITSTALPDFVQ
ncbi:hypothetical protein B0J14DRAFT_639337 [Halenospora varia]|nr:hypothetical protein B0J14DRAFT_639337 [Halenospora varia]